MNQFIVPEDGHVADFGAGAGAYVFPAAEQVGPEGRVYAVDVQKDLLAKIKAGAVERGFSNVEIIWGDVEEPGGSKLGDESMDAVIATNILFQLDDKEGVAREAARVLAPRGRVLVVDWKDSFGGLGPQPERLITEDAARRLFEREGFEFEKSIYAGDHHYGIIFKK